MSDTDLSTVERIRQIKLTTPEIRMLEHLIERGGEVPWDWSKLTPNAKAMIANMINSGLVIEREYVMHAAQLHGDLKLRVTDHGRAVADHIAKMTIKPTEIATASA